MIKIYYKNMIDEYENQSNIKVLKNSDIELKIQLLSKYLSDLDNSITNLSLQASINTVTGEFLDHHGKIKGLIRKKSVSSKGEITFYRDKSYDGYINIPKGTKIQIDKLEGYIFKTDKEATIKEDEDKITAEASSLVGGINKNVGANCVNILTNPISHINKATNLKPFIDGKDIESDKNFRDRIINCYEKLSNGVNKGYYENLALENSNVYDAKLILDKNNLEAMDLIVVSKDGKISQENILIIKENINNIKELGRKINVRNADILTFDLPLDISVSENADFLETSKEVKSIVESYIKELKIGESLYVSQLIKLCMTQKYVVDVKINGLINNIIPLETEKIILSNIIISKGE